MLCTEFLSNINPQYSSIKITLWSTLFLLFLITLWSAFLLFSILKFHVFCVYKILKRFVIISATFSNYKIKIITFLILKFSISLLCCNKEIFDRLKMSLGVTSSPCSLLQYLTCPAIILSCEFNSLLLPINIFSNIISTPLLSSSSSQNSFGANNNFSDHIFKSQISTSCVNHPTVALCMGIFNNLLTSFIHFVINTFYDPLFNNIYELSLNKFYISDMTMTGITSATPGLINPFLHNLNSSTNFYIEGNNILPTIPEPWVSIPFIIVLGVLLFSFLLYFNYKLYCKSVKKFQKSEKTRVDLCNSLQ